MTNTPWYAHATVATIVKQDNKYLMVYEKTAQGNKYNQPAGHLEPNETLLQAAIRETEEETGWQVTPTRLVRINQFTAPSNNTTYLRITIEATATKLITNAKLDSDIIAPYWLTKDDIIEQKAHLRSPLVLSDIEFYEQNEPISLDYLYCPQ